MAGLAAGLALHRRGHDVTLLEAFDAPRPLGSGLLLQPSGLAALRALGLLDPILALGARVERLEGLDAAGRPVMKMSYAHWRPGAFGLGVHRASLFGVLHDAARQAGLEIRTGAEITAIEDFGEPRLRDRVGRVHGPFDLVVAADGAASPMRELVRPRARSPVYPWGAVWANATDMEGRFAGALHQRYDRASTMIGVLPIGAGPDGERDLVSFFWSLRVDRMTDFFAGDLRAWGAEVARLWPEASAVVAQLENPERFSRAVYRNVVAGGWSRGPFLLIGDAAHGTSPQLGQGANLGLIDAVELAARVPAPDRIAGYERARRLQTGPYQLMSRALTPLFQSGGWLGPLVRRYLFAPLSQAPGLRRIAAIVLTGVFRLGPTPKGLRP